MTQNNKKKTADQILETNRTQRQDLMVMLTSLRKSLPFSARRPLIARALITVTRKIAHIDELLKKNPEQVNMMLLLDYGEWKITLNEVIKASKDRSDPAQMDMGVVLSDTLTSMGFTDEERQKFSGNARLSAGSSSSAGGIGSTNGGSNGGKPPL